MKQLSVVVQHLLEVRHLPTLIHRVAVKATAQLIVNSTSGHSLESKHHRIPEARTSVAPIRPQRRSVAWIGLRARSRVRRATSLSGLPRIAPPGCGHLWLATAMPPPSRAAVSESPAFQSGRMEESRSRRRTVEDPASERPSTANLRRGPSAEPLPDRADRDPGAPRDRL